MKRTSRLESVIVVSARPFRRVLKKAKSQHQMNFPSPFYGRQSDVAPKGASAQTRSRYYNYFVPTGLREYPPSLPALALSELSMMHSEVVKMRSASVLVTAK